MLLNFFILFSRFLCFYAFFKFRKAKHIYRLDFPKGGKGWGVVVALKLFRNLAFPQWTIIF
jgi:hypothetical protein